MSPQLAFEMFDGDESGSISFNEFCQVFNKLNTDAEQQVEFKAELRELFYNTNTSNTGRVDYGEFHANFDKILEAMAEHSVLFDKREILGELGDVLGKTRDKKSKLGIRLPDREASLVRNVFGYIVFVTYIIIFQKVCHIYIHILCAQTFQIQQLINLKLCT